MKLKIVTIYVIVTLLWVGSCREQLISSGDENKETLLQGAWVLTESVPARPGQIYLIFKSNLTVDVTVINVDTFFATYNFRVEKGNLYFLINDDNQTVEFSYKLESLTSLQLVLSFVDNGGNLITQTYTRPS